MALDRFLIRSILPFEVAKVYKLFSGDSGEATCRLSKKEISFLEENLEEVVEEDQDFTLTEDDIACLILCNAGDDLVEKLRKSLGDDYRSIFYYSQE